MRACELKMVILVRLFFSWLMVAISTWSHHIQRWPTQNGWPSAKTIKKKWTLSTCRVAISRWQVFLLCKWCINNTWKNCHQIPKLHLSIYLSTIKIRIAQAKTFQWHIYSWLTTRTHISPVFNDPTMAWPLHPIMDTHRPAIIDSLGYSRYPRPTSPLPRQDLKVDGAKTNTLESCTP